MENFYNYNYVHTHNIYRYSVYVVGISNLSRWMISGDFCRRPIYPIEVSEFLSLELVDRSYKNISTYTVKEATSRPLPRLQ